MSKILAILLVVAMLVTVFVGCGEKKDDATQSTGGDASSKTSSLASDWYKDFSFSVEPADPSSTTTSTTSSNTSSTSSKDTTATSSTASGATSSVNSNDEGWSSWWTPEY